MDFNSTKDGFRVLITALVTSLPTRKQLDLLDSEVNSNSGSALNYAWACGWMERTSSENWQLPSSQDVPKYPRAGRRCTFALFGSSNLSLPARLGPSLKKRLFRIREKHSKARTKIGTL